MRDWSKRLRDDVSLLRVLLPHPSDMPVQMPPGDEVSEHLLRRPGDLFIGQMLDLTDPLTKPGRSHQIPNAQGRGQHFCERPDIGYSPCLIKACQSWEWGGIEAKLTVVIIFDNEAIVGLSPCQQRQAS